MWLLEILGIVLFAAFVIERVVGRRRDMPLDWPGAHLEGTSMRQNDGIFRDAASTAQCFDPRGDDDSGYGGEFDPGP